MRTVPSYAEQTEVWADLLDKLGFKQIIFIHSSDQEGRAMLGKFQSKTESDSKKVVAQLWLFDIFHSKRVSYCSSVITACNAGQ